MARVRITRQEMKHDEFVDFMTRATLLVERHWRRIVLVASSVVAVVVVGLGAYGWISWSRAAAREQLAQAEGLLFGIAAPSATDPTDPAAAVTSAAEARNQAALGALDEYVARHGADGADGMASFYRGIALLRMKRGAEADEALQSALKSAPDPNLKNLIRHSLATAAVQRGDLPLAEQRLAELAASAGLEGYPGDVVLSDLARVQEAQGKLQDAQATRARLRSEFPASSLNDARPSAPAPAPLG